MYIGEETKWLSFERSTMLHITKINHYDNVRILVGLGGWGGKEEFLPHAEAILQIPKKFRHE